jgi:short-subunit dehydrogenase
VVRPGSSRPRADALIVVARTRHRLEELAEDPRREAGVRVETLTAAPPVDLLVNNAGIMPKEPFPYTDGTGEEHVLAVNVHAVLRLTHAALPAVIERGPGRIVNVASLGAHGPGDLATTYPAGEAWVLAFSEAVGRSAQVRRAGVRVVALLSGFVRAELHERSGIDLTNPPRWMWLDADRVAAAALRGLERGRNVSVPSTCQKLAARGLRRSPRPLLRPLAWDFSTPSGFRHPRTGRFRKPM